MRYQKMPSPGSFAAGQTVTFALPKGPTYNRLDIEMNVDGVPRSVPVSEWGTYIGDIRVLVNGSVRIVWDAAEMVAFLQGYKRVLSDGVLPIMLTQPWARTMQGEDATAYGTNDGVASFNLEIDLKAGNTINKLEVYAEQTAPRPFGPHMTVQRFSTQSSLIGTKEITDIPRGDYNMFSMYVTTDQVDRVEVLANNVQFRDSTKIVRDACLRLRERDPQAGYTHIDFMERNRVGDVMPMLLQDFRLKLDVTAADQNFDIYAISMQAA